MPGGLGSCSVCPIGLLGVSIALHQGNVSFGSHFLEVNATSFHKHLLSCARVIGAHERNDSLVSTDGACNTFSFILPIESN